MSEHAPVGYDHDGYPLDCVVDGEPWPCRWWIEKAEREARGKGNEAGGFAPRSAAVRWLVWRWHLLRMGDRWAVHSYGCDWCEDR